MGRYLGPKVKLSRRVGVPIADIPKHTAKELSIPGMHGYRGRRNTEYGVRLAEKQKLRFHYSMMEKQFRRFLTIAKGSCGEVRAQLYVALDQHGSGSSMGDMLESTYGYSYFTMSTLPKHEFGS